MEGSKELSIIYAKIWGVHEKVILHSFTFSAFSPLWIRDTEGSKRTKGTKNIRGTKRTKEINGSKAVNNVEATEAI